MTGLFKYVCEVRRGLFTALLVSVLLSYCDTNAVQAAAADRKYTITASAGPGGSISPSGRIRVEDDDDQKFIITPDPGYKILDVLVDGKSRGALSKYTFEDVESDHTISATFIKKVIEILNVTIPDEPMKIGDEVTATITVEDDAGIFYTLVSGSVGGYPLEEFHRISATTYQAHFSIYQGGNSYEASEDIPVSNVIISNGVNESDPFNMPINQGNDPVDANAPGVIKMEVPSIEVGVGGMVKVTITADGTGYTAGTGTMVNGITLESSRMTFTERSMGMYELSYTVAVEDADVAPGSLQASIVLVDAAGNLGDPYSLLAPNSLEIYTALPEATLAGIPEICEGEETELSVFLSGRSPWSFTLDEGTAATNFTDITSTTLKIAISPVQTTVYQISSVTDVNGVENTGTGAFQVTVHEKTDVEIINLNTGYSVDADPVKLEANVPGGVFSGPGVISTTGYFYPELAGIADSPHTIYYTYENAGGCISMASKLVYVSGDEAAILIPKHVFCSNDDPFLVSVMNLYEAPGFFRLLNSADRTVSGLTGHGDQTATVDPALLDADTYTIEYQVTDGDPVNLTETFSVEIVQQPRILNLDETSYCQNVAPFVLRSDFENVLFEGPGVSGDLDEGFTFNPGDTDPGNVEITCSSISDNGCSASTSKDVQILFVPQVKFGMSSTCIPDGGEIVSFDNQTNGISSVETWNWDFDDPASGEDNQSSLSDPTHFYKEPGRRRISLTATTFEGCESTCVLDSVIDSNPQVNFTWNSNCFAGGSDVRFVNSTVYGLASADTILWTFKTGNGNVLDVIGSVSPSDTVAFSFDTTGRYTIDLYTVNSAGCSGEITKEILLRPTIPLEEDGYDESFDEAVGSWTIHSEDQVESWTWDVPDFNGYNGITGDKAWFTRLPVGEEDYMEHSWIQSPCFDFSGMDRPLIQLDIMQSFVPNFDGAVFQYQDVVEEGWKTVGEYTPGIEWYNNSSIMNLPGRSSIGWGTDEFNPDTGWVTAVHDLDQVAGNPNVSFRIAIATNGRLAIGNQGFAFDNLVIAERTKLSVLEHFTEYSDDSSMIANEIIHTIGKKYSKDVIDLQYHLSDEGVDPMFLNNPHPSSTRSFTYGVPGPPYTILNGGAYPFHRYDFPSLKTGALEDHVQMLSLEIPEFDIDLTVDWLESGLEAHATVTCMTDRFDEYIQLYLVVFETSVTGYTGNAGSPTFRNVVLDMLPSPAGILLGDRWIKGKSDVRTHSWTYPAYVEDVDDLAVAAFVQDRTSNRILHAAVEYKDKKVMVPDHITGTRSIHIFPNPATTTLYVNLGSGSEKNGSIELMDISGKVMLNEHVPAGTGVFQLNIALLSPGIYFLQWIDSGQVRGVSKFVKTL